jgi:DNA-binding NarL/FixJ family response regulator
MKVYVVDAHEVVRRGVKSILSEQEDMTIVGESTSVASALLRVPVLKPDVAVLGVLFELSDGVTLCRDLLERTPNLACLMLASATDEDVMIAAFLAGAAGVVAKTISAADLVAAVRTVGSGGALLDRRVAAGLLERLRHVTPEPGPFAELTEIEHEVLDLVGEGLTNRQIAERMFVAEKTVKNYVSHVLTKLDVTSRTQAAIAVTADNRDR